MTCVRAGGHDKPCILDLIESLIYTHFSLYYGNYCNVMHPVYLCEKLYNYNKTV